MTLNRVLLLCVCLPLNAHTIFASCSTKRLGGNGETVTFQCDSNSAPVWRHNGVNLTGNNEKYQMDTRSLTVNDIVGNDEGDYSCVQSSGCLLVYGKADFTRNDDIINVSVDGTVMFDLKLSFSQSGPSMNKQTVSKYTLKRNSEALVTCESVCSFHDPDPHHWWTVEEVMETGHVFALHQAKSSDRGSYTAEVEVKHPNGNTISVLTKMFHVTSLECDKLHPGIENGRVSTLESAESDINGAQANYSCNDGCELEGSKSLRCQIVVTGHIATSQWVNDTEQNKMPSCSCPPPGITPTHTFTVSNEITRIKSTSTSMFLTSVSGQVSEVEATPPLVVAVGVTTGLSLVFILVTVLIVISVVILLRRRSEIKRPPEAEAYYQGADDNDSPENQSVSHISHSDYDDNVSNHEDIIEIPASFKNSDPFPI